MRRLIDANALKVKGFADPETGEGIIYVKDIDEAPTVDAVEVVRCKDCKNYMTIHCTCDGCCISDYWYCADGERKDNDL